VTHARHVRVAFRHVDAFFDRVEQRPAGFENFRGALVRGLAVLPRGEKHGTGAFRRVRVNIRGSHRRRTGDGLHKSATIHGFHETSLENQKSEVRSQKPGVRSQKPEARSQESRVESRKSGVRLLTSNWR